MKTPSMLRKTVVAALAGALVLTAAGCSDSDKTATATTAEAGGDSATQDSGAAKEDLTDPEPEDESRPQDDGQHSAQVTGGDNLVLTITSVRRGSNGKWVTVQGDIKNDGGERFIHTSRWGTGDLEDIRTNPRGISGASLTDEANSKANPRRSPRSSPPRRRAGRGRFPAADVPRRHRADGRVTCATSAPLLLSPPCCSWGRGSRPDRPSRTGHLRRPTACWHPEPPSPRRRPRISPRSLPTSSPSPTSPTAGERTPPRK